MVLNNLGNTLGSRYERSVSLEDLENAITCERQAVKATPPDHPVRAERLSNLGNLLVYRYKSTGAMDDLEEAIHVTREALRVPPEDHPD